MHQFPFWVKKLDVFVGAEKKTKTPFAHAPMQMQ
jgi:hypothetical protein